VLGYPLKPLNEYFGAEPRIEDICVRSESRISRILPYWLNISAHTDYWTNATVLSRTAALIRKIVEAIRLRMRRVLRCKARRIDTAADCR
jgi:hypothetical protein